MGGSPEVRSSRSAWPSWRNPIFKRKKKKDFYQTRRTALLKVKIIKYNILELKFQMSPYILKERK